MKNSEQEKKSYKIWKREQFLKNDFPFYIDLSIKIPHPDIRNQREFWKISCITDGTGEYLVNNRVYKYSPGTIILTHPDSVTAYRHPGNDLRCYNILFDLRLINDNLPPIQDDFGFFSIFFKEFSPVNRDSIYVLKGDNEMKSLIKFMHREFNRKDLNYRICIRYSLLKLLMLMMRRSAKRGLAMTPEEIADYVNNFLRQNFHDDFILSNLSRRLGMRSSSLCRVYNRNTGSTITAYLKKLRLEAAMNELKTTDNSITGICYRCGFNDLSYFYRSFHAYYGMKPSNTPRPLIEK
ncbi:MAG TPA: hypothetical protein DC049_19535 [Spirochaetia bacterium]|nr:hypothetical protein [Spirochaetia bacterium]